MITLYKAYVNYDHIILRIIFIDYGKGHCKMDKIKDAGLQLSIVNLMATVGTSTYFYKRLENQQAELLKITTTLGNLLSRMAEWEKDEPNRREVIRGVREEVRRLEMSIAETSKTPAFDMEELVNSLGEQSIPHYAPLPRKGPQERKKERVEEVEDNDHLINLIRNAGCS